MSGKVAPSLSLADDPLFADLKKSVVEKTGLAYYLDKDEELARILAQRMRACGCRDFAAYALRLNGPDGLAEQDELISELTIGETYFFRHPEVFAALENHILPELIERNALAKSLSIWSAGCSSGAEIHSVAILLESAFAKALDGWRLRLIGTDIDKKFLAQARSGLYHDWALRATSPEERSARFEKTASGWKLKDAYRRLAVFHPHNLIQDALPNAELGLERLDLVLCRNVAIYFSRQQIRDLMRRFCDSLKDGGWLITGPAEFGVERPEGFKPVNLDGLIVYRKEGGATTKERAKPVWQAPKLDAPLPSLAQGQTAASCPADAGLCDANPKDDDDDELRRLAQRGQWIAALGPARRVLAMAGASLDGVFTAVQVLIEVGDYDSAEKALKRLLFIDRKCQMAYYHLGLLLMCRGEERLAAKAFRNAFDLAAAAPPDAPVPGADGLLAGQLAAMAGPRAQLEGKAS